jgi:Tol biopolymer transport system component
VLQLWAAKLDGSGMVQLTDGAARSATPSWGKDGWIYFSSDREGSFDVYRLKPGGDLSAP